MTVHFVGAGPGAADLITVRAQRLLSQCSVCLYAGSLVPAEVLALCPPGARLVDTADLTLDQITAAMVEADAAGLDVVRLCSGDPAVFYHCHHWIGILCPLISDVDYIPNGLQHSSRLDAGPLLRDERTKLRPDPTSVFRQTQLGHCAAGNFDRPPLTSTRKRASTYWV